MSVGWILPPKLKHKSWYLSWLGKLGAFWNIFTFPSLTSCQLEDCDEAWVRVSCWVRKRKKCHIPFLGFWTMVWFHWKNDIPFKVHLKEHSVAQWSRWMLSFSLLHKKPCMGELAASLLLFGAHVPVCTHVHTCAHTHTNTCTHVNAGKIIFKSGDKAD